MLLKSLELQGFKTFPDKTKLSFGSGITAVVGPNGSGKSNISDAIRWVLGEQSIKTLRCSKMEDVIFGGTPFRKAQGFAEVILVIDNTDGKLQFDGDEVAVCRRYYRSGESEYLINNVSVRLKDIHELFMDTGLGRDGYSIISQGKIDSIVASKSEDRREIFEEAAGISRYRYRKLEAEKKLKQAQENLLRLKDILNELELRVGPLKEQAQKAKEYLKLIEEKRSLEIGIWLDNIEKLSLSIREQESKLAISKNQYDDVEEDIDNIKIESDKIFTDSNLLAVKSDEIRKSISISEEEVLLKVSKISVLKNDIVHNNQDVKKLQDDIENTKNSSFDIDTKISVKKLDIEEKEKRIKEKEDELNQTITGLNLLNKDINTFSSEIDSLSLQISSMSVKASDIKINNLTVISTISELESRIKTVVTEIDSYKSKIESLENTQTDYLEMHKNSKQIISELENTLNGYEFKLKNKKQKLNELKKISDALSLDSEGKVRRIRFLEELERNLEGFAQSVKTIMKEARNGTLLGIYGPVSRLLKVPNEYAVAVETALGASMQNIVVEDEVDAKRAIILLKHRDSGRATFLPISTIKGRKLENREFNNCKGFIGIASDICQCDSKYNCILESLLGRVIIADNIDNAANIARKFSYKFKVVTLDGQVMNIGGSLTGGSISRKTGLISRISEIEKLKKEAESLKIKANNSYMDYKKFEEECSDIEYKLIECREKLSRAQEDNIRISAECRNCQNDIDNAKNLSNQYINEKNTLEKRINELNVERQKSQEEYKNISEYINKAEKKIASITGDRKSLSDQREKFTDSMQELKLLLVSLRKDVEILASEVLFLENTKSDQSERVKSLENEILFLNKKEDLILEDIAILEIEVDNLKKQVQGYEKQIEECNKEKMLLEKKSVELRQQERDKLTERENVSRELARLEEKKAMVQKEYDVIISKLWEEYELTKREAQEISEIPQDMSKAQRTLGEIKLKIKKLGSINIAAIDEYKEVAQRYEFLKHQLDDVEKSRTELLKMIEDLTKQMRELFMDRFNKINSNFSQTFKELFGGGNAMLSMTDSTDILNSGIEISVQPPGKIVSHLEALSGGEKALIAISLYFAIMKVSPAPFCVLDEIEAALDDVNVDRYAAYLRKMNNNTQFIVVTHRRGTMEEADVLYGVTMQDEGISKLLELRTSEIEKELGIKSS